MMALRVKIMDVKTFKFNLACTKPYNADFDGDEMNAHAPQSEESKAELFTLSTPKQCIMSCQSGKPNLNNSTRFINRGIFDEPGNNNDNTLTMENSMIF